MRFSRPKKNVVLLLILTLGWLGWSAAAERAVAQGIFQRSGCYADACQAPCMEDQCMGPDACEAPCESLCGDGPRWHFTAEAIALERTTTRSQTLFSSAQQATSELDAHDLNFPVGLGYQVSAIRKDLCGSDWEIRFFQVDGFSAQTDLSGTSHLWTDVNGTGYLVNNATALYNSAIYSGELNVRRPWSDAFTFLAGFRMGQLNEHYLASGTAVASSTINDSLREETYNHLYGFQLGADVNVYDRGGPLLINVVAKGGVLGNYAYNQYCRMVVDDGIVTTYDSHGAGRNQAAFLGEAEAAATYALTKRLAFRASLKAMWLTGVALAPEQVAAVNLRTEEYSLNTSGAVFYYGGGMGLEYRY